MSNIRLFFRLLLPACWVAAAPLSPALARDTPPSLNRFLTAHCTDCHDDSVSKGDLNLADLEFDLSGPAGFEQWNRIYDRVQADEMPPKKKNRVGAAEKTTFLASLKDALVAADLAVKNATGRVNVRRLTRREYEHTIHDLLGVDMPLQELLPEDPATHGFETVATGQQLSHHHLRRYLEAADQVLRHAFARATLGESDF